MGNRTGENINGEQLTYATNSLNQYTGRATSTKVPVSGTAAAGSTVQVDGSALSAAEWQNQYFYRAIGKNPVSGGLQTVSLNATQGGASASRTLPFFVRPTTEQFSYDANGNLTSDGLWVYTYDGADQLVQMVSQYADASGHRVALRFTYDYQGRRAAKAVYAATPEGLVDYGTCQSRRVYVYNGWTLLAEYDQAASGGSRTLVRTYTWGPDIAGGTASGGIGGLLAIQDHRAAYAGTYLTAYDGNGNINALVAAASGTLAAVYEYDGYGNVLRASGTYAKENPYRFSTKYHDVETGLAYYGYRYYSASMGRFINRDPMREAGGINIYAFASNEPIGGWDYMGLWGDDGEIIEMPVFNVNSGSGWGMGSSGSSTYGGISGTYSGFWGYGNSGYWNFGNSISGMYNLDTVSFSMPSTSSLADLLKNGDLFAQTAPEGKQAQSIIKATEQRAATDVSKTRQKADDTAAKLSGADGAPGGSKKQDNSGDILRPRSAGQIPAFEAYTPEPVGSSEYIVGVDIDVVLGAGVEIGFGMVCNPSDREKNGLYFTFGPAVGGNVGAGIGAGWAKRGIEGVSVNLDLNLAKVSPSLNFDAGGFNGWSGSYGVGAGASASWTRTVVMSLPNPVWEMPPGMNGT